MPKFAVVITDGNSNINRRQTVAEAIKTHVEGVHVIAVPIGKSFVNMAEIEAIASEPKPANIIRIDNVTALETIVNNVTTSVCDGKTALRGKTTVLCEANNGVVQWLAHQSGRLGVFRVKIWVSTLKPRISRDYEIAQMSVPSRVGM